MNRKEMEKRIEEAAVEGSIRALHEILEEDRLALHRIMVGCLIHTPLHVAAFHGHIDFAREILQLKPELAQVLDQRRWSPLHLASAQGHVQIVKELVSVNPYMCTILDGDGRNPLHLAAINGRVDVLRVLVRASPHAARARVDREDETVLHLCVKHNQPDTLKLLLEEGITSRKFPQFVNAKDGYGNTILHLAALDERSEIVKYLLTCGTVDVTISNANGCTALEILSESQRKYVPDLDVGNSSSIQDVETLTSSIEAANIPSSGGRNGQTSPAVRVPSVVYEHATTPPPPGEMPSSSVLGIKPPPSSPPPPPGETNSRMPGNEYKLENIREALLVVASFSTSVAFQAGISPPGGVWQEDHSPTRKAGKAVIASSFPTVYQFYLYTNTLSILASMAIIMLVTSGLPFKRKRFMQTLIIIMTLSLTFMASTYTACIIAISPEKDRSVHLFSMIALVSAWWIVMFGMLTVVHMDNWRRRFSGWLKLLCP